LQAEVGDRLFERLEGLRVCPSQIIDAGCGVGAHTGRLSQKYPQARIVALDFASAMLRQIKPAEPIARVAADVESLPLAEGAAQLYWSNLCWQWADLNAAVGEARRALASGGLLLFSTLGPDTLYELRAAFAQEDDFVHVGEFADMHNIGDALAAGGFEEAVLECEKIVLTYADVTDAARELKGVGAAAAYPGMPRALTGKHKWRRVKDFYRDRFALADGKIPATFEVVYAHAFRRRPAPAEREVKFFAPPRRRLF
jgi:malonyl-CoA O-methyltransferase